MKFIKLITLLLFSLSLNAQNLTLAVKLNVSGSSTNVGSSFTFGGTVIDDNGILNATDVLVGDSVFYLEEGIIYPLVITTKNSASGASLNITCLSGTPSVTTAPSGSISGQVAISRKTFTGYCSVPPGLNATLAAAMENRFKQQVDLAIVNAQEIVFTSGSTPPANILATSQGYRLAKTNMGDGDLYEWNGSTWVLNNRSGGGTLSDGDYGDIDVKSGGTVMNIDTLGATNGQVLTWNGSSWAPSTVSGGGGTLIAKNGLTKSVDSIILGGTLDRNTIIIGASKDFSLTGIDTFNISATKITANLGLYKYMHNTGAESGGGGAYMDNTFLGYQAGQQVKRTATGYANTGIGKGALSGLTGIKYGGLRESSSNTAIGYNSGSALTTGTGNVFVGTAAGNACDTAVYASVMVGWHAGISAKGSYSTLIGRNAGQTSTSAQLVALGAEAMPVSTGTGNTGLGYNTGDLNTSGSKNTYVGWRSGANNTTGEENTYFGYNAGSGSGAATSGYNVAIGSNAGKSLIGIANTNCFVGRTAGESTTTGVGNLFFGKGAGALNTTGSNNIAFGTDITLRNTTITGDFAIARILYGYEITGGRTMLGIGDYRQPGMNNLKATLNVRSFNKLNSDTCFVAQSSDGYVANVYDMFGVTSAGRMFSVGGFSQSGDVGFSLQPTYSNTGGNANFKAASITPIINETSADTTASVYIKANIISASDYLGIWQDENKPNILGGSLKIGSSKKFPTAKVDIEAGTATAGSAPIKLTSGTNLTTPEAGAIEYNGTDLFVTNSTANRYSLCRAITVQSTLDYPSIAPLTTVTLTITVTGATTQDFAVVQPVSGVASNTIVTSWVSGPDTVTVSVANLNSIAIDPPSQTFNVKVIKN